MVSAVRGAKTPRSPEENVMRSIAPVTSSLPCLAGAAHAACPDGAAIPRIAEEWRAAELNRAGRALTAGDLIGVGSFSPLTPPGAGRTVTVTYEGLPGSPKVSVSFE